MYTPKEEECRAAFLKHHRYDGEFDAESISLEPITQQELAALAEIGKAAANSFVSKTFACGNSEYKRVVIDPQKLFFELRRLTGDLP